MSQTAARCMVYQLHQQCDTSRLYGWSMATLFVLYISSCVCAHVWFFFSCLLHTVCQHECKWLTGKTFLWNDLLFVKFEINIYSFTQLLSLLLLLLPWLLPLVFITGPFFHWSLQVRPDSRKVYQRRTSRDGWCGLQRLDALPVTQRCESTKGAEYIEYIYHQRLHTDTSYNWYSNFKSQQPDTTLYSFISLCSKFHSLWSN